MSMFKEIPKVAFLFLVFAIISGGYVQTVLSCEVAGNINEVVGQT